MAHDHIEVDLRRKYTQVFYGIGKLKNYEQTLDIDNQVPPVAHRFICASNWTNGLITISPKTLSSESKMRAPIG